MSIQCEKQEDGSYRVSGATFNYRDQIKQLGGRWQGETKSWGLPATADVSIIDTWNTELESKRAQPAKRTVARAQLDPNGTTAPAAPASEATSGKRVARNFADIFARDYKQPVEAIVHEFSSMYGFILRVGNQEGETRVRTEIVSQSGYFPGDRAVISDTQLNEYLRVQAKQVKEVTENDTAALGDFYAKVEDRLRQLRIKITESGHRYNMLVVRTVDEEPRYRVIQWFNEPQMRPDNVLH